MHGTGTGSFRQGDGSPDSYDEYKEEDSDEQPFSPHGAAASSAATLHSAPNQADPSMMDTVDTVNSNSSAIPGPSSRFAPASPAHASSSASSREGVLMVDVGIYGRVTDKRGEQYTRLLDVWAVRNNARKMVR